MATRTPGRVAYDAYGDAVEWRAVSGDRMPRWDEQDELRRAAWEAAAMAGAHAQDPGDGEVSDEPAEEPTEARAPATRRRGARPATNG